jgi:hypothetical protein
MAPAVAAGGAAGQALPQASGTGDFRESPFRTKRINKGLFLGIIFGCFVGAGVFTGIVFANLSHMHEAAPFTFLPIIPSIVFFIIFHYRAWAAIQDSQTKLKPGMALGFLFIPGLCFYWVFRAFFGWAKEYNSFIARNQIEAPRANPTLFLLFTIASLCIVVPFLNLLALPAAIVLFILVFLKMASGVNAIYEARAD